MNKTGLQVLFIEDNADDTELAVLQLERDGFDVTWDRVDTEPALRKTLASQVPDIVLSDFSMPAFDGPTALKVVKEVAPDIPFLFLSGTIGEERAIDAIRGGATDYILKENTRRLGTAVRRALEEATERRRTRILEEERSRLVTILEMTTDLVSIADPDGTIIYMNAGGRKLLGFGQVDIRSISKSDLYADCARDFLNNEARPAALRDGSWGGEMVLSARDGTEIPVSQVIIAHRTSAGDLQYTSTIARDIRERKAHEQRIQYLVNYDALTDLPNRSLLADRVMQVVAFGHRTRRFCALFIANVDQFKLVNDGYGQVTGDRLLCLVAKRLSEIVREGDTVARLGADSFAVLAADLTHSEDVYTIARKIQDGFVTPFHIEERELRITISIGVSVYPRDGNTFDDLLQSADAAMHRAKAAGESGFRIFDAGITRDAADRIEIETELRSAAQHNDLELHYQPQIALRSGRIIGVEALMRWQHPQRGWVPPGVFIPIAENSDLIFSLGNWALAAACMQCLEWQQAGLPGLRMAVNVSARQFRSTGFVETVDRILRECGLESSLLELELTESVLVQNEDYVIDILNELKSLGVHIAVDDFGTGYSSLSYLSRLPVDRLKIDQSFVRRCLENRYDAAIINAIISLASSLGLEVIAEGIETLEQLDFLRTHGCEQGQGYLFSRPLPATSIPALAMQQLPGEGDPEPTGFQFNLKEQPTDE